MNAALTATPQQSVARRLDSARAPTICSAMNYTLSQKIERWLARALLNLPDFLVRLLAGKTIVRDGLQLDPHVQLLLKLQRLSAKKLVKETASIEQMRANLDAESNILTPALAALEQVRELQLQGPADIIPARLYRPPGLAAPAPLLLYFHGGGYALGSLASHDAPCRWLALNAGCVVIAVDYRLAPEHPFPAGVDDALAAFRAVVARAAEFGIDTTRIAVGGDSAGGNLATVVAQQVRGEALQPCFQLLIYPTTDATLSSPSINIFASGFLLERASMVWFVNTYLPAHQDRRDPRCSPLFGEVQGLPPALLMTAGFDPLRDEGEAYAAKLSAAGVSVDLRRYDSLVHGFLNMTGGVRAAASAVQDAAAALRAAFVQRPT
ncbi:MAG: alpha/beta hydrolase [Nevskia sp.]|nr:alpha/beta hydrolase [Nevskia sp.]